MGTRNSAISGDLEANGTQEDHSGCGVFKLKHRLMQHSLEIRTVCQVNDNGIEKTVDTAFKVEDERFSEDRTNGETELLDWRRRMGFWRGR